jgi:plasmid stabilization system protein ParE
LINSLDADAQAGRDIEDAASFYAREASPRVAGRLVAESMRVAALLSVSPGLGTPRRSGRRGFPMSGFPFSLVYR